MTPEQLKEEKSNELDDPVLKSPTRGNKIGFNLSADSFQFPDFPVPSFLSSDVRSFTPARTSAVTVVAAGGNGGVVPGGLTRHVGVAVAPPLVPPASPKNYAQLPQPQLSVPGTTRSHTYDPAALLNYTTKNKPLADSSGSSKNSSHHGNYNYKYYPDAATAMLTSASASSSSHLPLLTSTPPLTSTPSYRFECIAQWKSSSKSTARTSSARSTNSGGDHQQRQGQLGVDVHETSDGRMLRIESVHETGLVHEWNVLSLQRERKTGGSTGSYSSSSSGGGRSSSSFYSHAVQAGDYITGANGVRNDAKGMLAECSSRGAAEKTLRLEILRVLN
eukprot:CAMPEP_0178988150 /NCGR_PEP_ID=MMETSP0795-20121207/3657_1 /TAXON_ID=88552 /ORGANISM="Amoebophrya sp., Strain Ameob2" /LENGTH=332 /DNA_ID=CAMNT_0020679405 /DNA_START=214 /DNA_END=1212 /DNA_ORIENTATION=-